MEMDRTNRNWAKFERARIKLIDAQEIIRDMLWRGDIPSGDRPYFDSLAALIAPAVKHADKMWES